eukprot:5383-Prorocentrum_minimum.AAC.1
MAARAIKVSTTARVSAKGVGFANSKPTRAFHAKRTDRAGAKLDHIRTVRVRSQDEASTAAPQVRSRIVSSG